MLNVDPVIVCKLSVAGSPCGHGCGCSPGVSRCTQETNRRRWQNALRHSASKRWLAFAYSVPTRSEAFRFQGRHKQPVWAYEPWNAGLLNPASMAWLASFVARADGGRRKLPAEALELIEGLFLKKPRPSASAVHRRVLALCNERKWPSPWCSGVYAIISRLDPALTTLAHEGPARFRDQFELVYRHRASHPNAIWQADHTQLDVLIRDASGEAIRTWLTTVIDDHSRALAGYLVFAGAPSAQSGGSGSAADLGRESPRCSPRWHSLSGNPLHRPNPRRVRERVRDQSLRSTRCC